MIAKFFFNRYPITWTLLIACFLVLLSACSSQPSPPDSTTAVPTESLLAHASPIPAHTETPEIPPTLSPPPSTFTSAILRTGVSPAAYLDYSCEYLAQRWDPEKSLPGTVIAPIMYHSIRPYGEEPGEASAINREYFDATIRLAKNLGFETITSEELAAFLQNNAKIPARSMLLILDDRRPGTAEDYFLPILQANDWTTTLAWPIGDTDSRTGLWEWMERLNETGYFDIQSHGLNHIYLTDSMPENQVREEVFDSIPILEAHFNQTPLAYIWPGGNYTSLGIELAQEAGFEIGFTVHARGPIMFNWIPQGEQELALNSPVMLLPRFWSPAALLNLEQSSALGDQAQLFAKENYPAEAAWYQLNCGATLANLSEIFKEN